MFNVFKKVKINGIKFTFEIIQIVRLKYIRGCSKKNNWTGRLS